MPPADTRQGINRPRVRPYGFLLWWQARPLSVTQTRATPDLPLAPDLQIGAQELSGASVTYGAHISHSSAQLEPQAGKGVIGPGDQQLLAR